MKYHTRLTITIVREGLWVLVLTILCAVVAEGLSQEFWQGQMDPLITVALGICLAVVLRWVFWGLGRQESQKLLFSLEEKCRRSQQ